MSALREALTTAEFFKDVNVTSSRVGCGAADDDNDRAF